MPVAGKGTPPPWPDLTARGWGASPQTEDYAAVAPGITPPAITHPSPRCAPQRTTRCLAYSTTSIKSSSSTSSWDQVCLGCKTLPSSINDTFGQPNSPATSFSSRFTSSDFLTVTRFSPNFPLTFSAITSEASWDKFSDWVSSSSDSTSNSCTSTFLSPGTPWGWVPERCMTASALLRAARLSAKAGCCISAAISNGPGAGKSGAGGRLGAFLGGLLPTSTAGRLLLLTGCTSSDS
mmetsp:Transcript_72256/g.121267  ORF Transcript_72256/g.121267 Transcript_72256/m.121267 type:complete len:236 (-) Transcript_72256:153-860(-)